MQRGGWPKCGSPRPNSAGVKLGTSDCRRQHTSNETLTCRIGDLRDSAGANLFTHAPECTHASITSPCRHDRYRRQSAASARQRRLFAATGACPLTPAGAPCRPLGLGHAADVQAVSSCLYDSCGAGRRQLSLSRAAQGRRSRGSWLVGLQSAALPGALRQAIGIYMLAIYKPLVSARPGVWLFLIWLMHIHTNSCILIHTYVFIIHLSDSYTYFFTHTYPYILFLHTS